MKPGTKALPLEVMREKKTEGTLSWAVRWFCKDPSRRQPDHLLAVLLQASEFPQNRAGQEDETEKCKLFAQVVGGAE